MYCFVLFTIFCFLLTIFRYYLKKVNFLKNIYLIYQIFFSFYDIFWLDPGGFVF